jgi:hypothetical protein
LFLGNKALYSDSLDTLQIGDDTYSVCCPVAAVKMKQIIAGIFGARSAELMAAGGKLSTVFYGTGETRVRLVAVTFSATGARAVISNECAARAAIHSTRCYQCSVIPMCIYSYRSHATPYRHWLRWRRDLLPDEIYEPALRPARE